MMSRGNFVHHSPIIYSVQRILESKVERFALKLAKELG
jgi:hypothetical protein